MKNEEKKVNEVEEKSAELTEEELAQVSGGSYSPLVSICYGEKDIGFDSST